MTDHSIESQRGEPRGYSLQALSDQIARVSTLASRECRVTIKKHNPGGLTAHQTTEVESVYAGGDWQAGQLVIVPARPLTELSPEDVAAIHQNAKAGESWHAYQAHKRTLEKLSAALGVECRSMLEVEREIEKLRARVDKGTVDAS